MLSLLTIYNHPTLEVERFIDKKTFICVVNMHFIAAYLSLPDVTCGLLWSDSLFCPDLDWSPDFRNRSSRVISPGNRM